MGVILRHRVKIGDAVVSNDVFAGGHAGEASVEVRYAVGEAPEFRIEIRDLPLPVTKSLGAKLERSPRDETGGIPVEVELGYFDGPRGRVLEGRIEQIEASVRNRPLLTTVTGHETALHRLLRRTRVAEVASPPATLEVKKPTPVPTLVTQIVTAAGVSLDGKAEPPDTKLEPQSRTAPNALALLDELAQEVGAEWLVQDGKVAFGLAVQSPMPGLLPSIPNPAALLDLVAGGDVLVELGAMKPARLAQLTPLTLGGGPKRAVATDLPEPETVQAFDFIVLGEPSLRAGQLVVASVADYENPFKPFRILSVTHRYTPREGYVCSGRAAAMAARPLAHANRQRTSTARGASPQAIAAKLGERARLEQAERPSIDVGRLAKAKSGDRTASFHYRQVPAPGQASTSVGADIPPDGPQLADKPVASPFAWHKVGLSVPLYPGMRAVLAQVRDARQDAIATGFVWANEPRMDRPPAEEGDWWLCLPTELGPDGQPTGKGANDLVAADGRRVIEAKGLVVRVGGSTLTALGSRPTEGASGELAIEHASGATIAIDAQGAITVRAASGQPLVLTDGVTRLELGSGKVQVS